MGNNFCLSYPNHVSNRKPLWMLQRKKQKLVIIEVSHSITTDTWGLLLQIIHKPKISLLKTDSELFSCLCKRSLQVNTEVGNKQCKYILISIYMAEIHFYMQHTFFSFSSPLHSLGEATWSVVFNSGLPSATESWSY